MMVDFEDLVGLSEPITKLIETIGNAIGWFFNPIQRKRDRIADVKTIRAISEVARENLDIPIKYEKNGIRIDTSEYSGIIERSAQRQIYQEFVKEINIEMIAEKAAKKLEKIRVVSKKPVDVGWTNMLLDSIGYTNDPMLQELWAEILASEVIKPGQTSRRTLEVVRRLSVEEAVIFEKVAEYVIYMEDVKNGVVDYFIPQDDSVLETVGISSVDMIRLEDAGLIANSVNVVENFTLRKCDKKEIYAGNDEIVVIVVNNDKKDRTFRKNIYLLSEAGREVYNVVHRRKVDTGKSDYYKAVENYFNRDDLAELFNGINEL